MRHGGSLEDVTHWYKKEKNILLATKLNAIRLLMMGTPQNEIAKVLSRDVSTIRNWCVRWNNNGLEGLKANHKGSKSKVTKAMRVNIEEIIEIKEQIDGRIVTGKLITGYIKKIPNRYKLFANLLYITPDGICKTKTTYLAL